MVTDVGVGTIGLKVRRVRSRYEGKEHVIMIR